MKPKKSVFQEKRLYTLLFLTTLAGLSLVQIIFYILMLSNSTVITKTLRESFDIGLYESDFDNASILMRNLEKADILDCVSLKIKTIDQLFVVYSSAVQETCNPSSFLLNGVRVEGSLAGNTGNSWIYSFVVRMDQNHVLLLWFCRLLSCIVSFALTYFFVQNNLHIKQKEDEISLNMRAIAHDLTSPIGLLRMLSSQQKSLNNDKTLGYMKNATERLSDISQTILDGTLDIYSSSRETFNIKKITEKIVEEKINFFGDSISVDIETSVANHNLNVIGNSQKFERILSNMINNSFEALSEKVSVLQMKIVLKSENSKITVQISDNGSGISDSLLNHLGEKVVKSTKKGGSGLGLYLAKKDIGEWGGEFKIKTTSPTGTTFEISLPRSV